MVCLGRLQGGRRHGLEFVQGLGKEGWLRGLVCMDWVQQAWGIQREGCMGQRLRLISLSKLMQQGHGGEGRMWALHAALLVNVI